MKEKLFKFDEQIYREFKAACILKNMTMKEVLQNFMKDYASKVMEAELKTAVVGKYVNVVEETGEPK